MHHTLASIAALAFLLVGVGCKTNDFKVVEALRVGMSQEEARATIASYGFERTEFLTRPTNGWPRAQTVMSLPRRAAYAEEKLNARVESAEYYAVSHGLLGFGQLFLFYGANGHLLEFYRVNIN